MINKKTILGVLIALTFFMSGCAQANDGGNSVIPPDIKGKFVFWSYRDVKNPWDAFVWENGKVRKLGGFASPKWMNNGINLVCFKDRKLTLINDRGKVLKVYDNTQAPVSITLNSNNKKVIYTSDKGTSKIDKIYLYDLEKETNELLIDYKNEYSAGELSVSPKGDNLVFTKNNLSDMKDGGIYTYDLNAKTLKLISKQGSFPAWFPDGEHIVIQTNRNEDWSMINRKCGVLMKINVNTGEKEILRELNFLIKDTRISKDGKYFYYSKPVAKGGYVIAVSPVDQPEVEIEVTKPVLLNKARGNSQDLYPDWYQGD